MGNASRKLGDIPDEQSGMTEKQMKAIKDTWHRFCDNNREYGVFLFLSLFIKHPEFLPMFPHFKGKPVSALKDDPMFRAHGCAIGYHITSLVDSLGDPAKFEVLARRNATDHLKRKGVKPSHFEVLGQCMVDVLQSKDEKYMTPEAVEAWQKFLSVSGVLLSMMRLQRF
ncbi:globin-like [Haemaphysalis longicornis]